MKFNVFSKGFLLTFWIVTCHQQTLPISCKETRSGESKLYQFLDGDSERHDNHISMQRCLDKTLYL